MFLNVCKQEFRKLYGCTTREFLGFRMQSCQGIIFIWTQTYREIFKYALVYLEVFFVNFAKFVRTRFTKKTAFLFVWLWINLLHEKCLRMVYNDMFIRFLVVQKALNLLDRMALVPNELEQLESLGKFKEEMGQSIQEWTK